MDPDKVLERMLELTEMLLNGDYTTRGRDILECTSAKICDSEELAELVEELDRQMRSGGFTPSRWEITKVENKPPTR